MAHCDFLQPNVMWTIVLFKRAVAQPFDRNFTPKLPRNFWLVWYDCVHVRDSLDVQMLANVVVALFNFVFSLILSFWSLLPRGIAYVLTPAFISFIHELIHRADGSFIDIVTRSSKIVSMNKPSFDLYRLSIHTCF